MEHRIPLGSFGKRGKWWIASATNRRGLSYTISLRETPDGDELVVEDVDNAIRFLEAVRERGQNG